MTAVIERIESQIDEIKRGELALAVDRFKPIAAKYGDVDIPDTGVRADDDRELGIRVGQVLTALMRQRGWTVYRLATESGVPSAINVTRILRGGWVLMHLGHFVRLCMALEWRPAAVLQEAMKPQSAIRDQGIWTPEQIASDRTAKKVMPYYNPSRAEIRPDEIDPKGAYSIYKTVKILGASGSPIVDRWISEGVLPCVKGEDGFNKVLGSTLLKIIEKATKKSGVKA